MKITYEFDLSKDDTQEDVNRFIKSYDMALCIRYLSDYIHKLPYEDGFTTRPSTQGIIKEFDKILNHHGIDVNEIL